MKTNANDPIDWSLVQLQETSPNGIHECRMGGLTKREYFAAMAMQGLLANSEWMQEYEGGKYLMHNEVISEVSVNLADALINALNKEQ